MLEDDETHFEPMITSYGMSSFPTHDLAFHVESEFEPKTTFGSTLIPYHVDRFGSTSHFAPPIPAVEATSHIPPRSRVSDPIRIPDLRQVTIGNSTYIITHISSSFLPSSSNVHPSCQNVATSYVHWLLDRLCLSFMHHQLFWEVMFILLEVTFLLPECIFLLPKHMFLLTECLMGHLMR